MLRRRAPHGAPQVRMLLRRLLRMSRDVVHVASQLGWPCGVGFWCLGPFGCFYSGWLGGFSNGLFKGNWKVSVEVFEYTF